MLKKNILRNNTPKLLFTITFFMLLSLFWIPMHSTSEAAIKCPKHTIFICKEEVQKLIADAITPLQTALDGLTGRTTTLENKINSLEKRVSTLEASESAELNQTPCQIPSQVTLFDDFTGNSLNLNTWDEFDNGASITVQNSNLILPGGSNIPFIRSKSNPFPTTGSFCTEFKIQYSADNQSGNGIGLSLSQQDNDASNLPTNEAIAFWQGNNFGLQVVSFGLTKAVIGSNPDLNSHIGKIVYDGTKYLVYLDGNLVYTSPALGRAQSLWIGHPSVNVNAPWSGFNLDYIKVTNGS